MVKQFPILLATLILTASGLASAAEPERDRNARVALALTAAAERTPKAPAPARGASCSCGDACDCGAGVCPACPASAAKPVTTYREVWYSDGRRTWRQLEAVAPGALPGGNCPNGRCPIPR